MYIHLSRSLQLTTRHSFRTWVATCLGQMTESNREEASQEMKQVIAEAYQSGTLWTTDWVGMQLKRCVPTSTSFVFLMISSNSLLPKPLPTVNLKRKMYGLSFPYNWNSWILPGPMDPPSAKRPRRLRRSRLQRLFQIHLMTRLLLIKEQNDSNVNMRSRNRNRQKAGIVVPLRPAHIIYSTNETYRVMIHPMIRTTNQNQILWVPKLDCLHPWMFIVRKNVWEWDTYTIVGTSGEVFKEYLRLTTVCRSLYCFWMLVTTRLGAQTRHHSSACSPPSDSPTT